MSWNPNIKDFRLENFALAKQFALVFTRLAMGYMRQWALNLASKMLASQQLAAN